MYFLKKIKGIEKADSLIVDPHKSLFSHFGMGVILVKNSDEVLHSDCYTANYIQDAEIDEMLKSTANLSPGLTNYFRRLYYWLLS